MKRYRVLVVLLLLVCLAGCSSLGPHEIAPGQFTDQELTYLHAVTEDALVFALGEGEYKATLYCYSADKWSTAGTLGPFNGGGNMLFVTHVYPQSSQRQPDTWVCNVDGMTFNGNMLWEGEGYANVKINSYLSNSIQMEPGTDYVVATCAFTDDEDLSSDDIEIGKVFNMQTANLKGFTYAWVLTVTAVL